MANRISNIKREIKETNISLEINIDGCGNYEIITGIRTFDHLLAQLARHGVFDINISATGDDQHHLVEDVAISLGKALSQALGDKMGIVRMGHALVPMDEALALVAVDIGGRGYAAIDAQFRRKKIGDMESDVISHFLETFAREGRLNLHVRILSGGNDHHMAEATFKALGRALDSATKIDPRITREVPSTKGVIEG